MKTQQRHIEEMLSREGWQVVERQAGTVWWLDEVWLLESVWSPVGCRAYLSFLVDPQVPLEREMGKQVWAVCATIEGPVRQWETIRCRCARTGRRRDVTSSSNEFGVFAMFGVNRANPRDTRLMFRSCGGGVG